MILNVVSGIKVVAVISGSEVRMLRDRRWNVDVTLTKSPSEKNKVSRKSS